MRLRLAPLLAGVVLLVVYIRIGAELGYHAVYGPAYAYDLTARHGFVHVGGTEYLFWLAHLVLLVPAAFLVAWGLAPHLLPALQRSVARVDAATPRQWRWAALAMFVALAALYALGHHLVLCDRPITDDENAVTFGGRMLAEGHLRVPEILPTGAFTELFIYKRDGLVSSMDFPGVVMFAAASVATGLGGVLYAIASAASGVAVAYAAKRWLGARACVLAAIIWTVSPMIAGLSITSHGHVPSRLFVALALACAARLDTGAGTPRRDAVFYGLCGGLVFLCRPLEAVALLAPLTAWLLWRAPRRVLGMLAGFAGPVATWAWYNAQLTGAWYVQPRFTTNNIGNSESRHFGVADRLGFNLGFNVLMLAVFFLGIPAIAMVIGALQRKRPILIVLGACVLAQIGLCLLHDNTGVHSVGPIHLSEVAAPLAILAAAGIVRGFAWLETRGLPQLPAALGVATYLVVVCGLFCAVNFASLHASAAAQLEPEEVVARQDIHHAIVLAPAYGVWAHDEVPQGSWVLQYPQPDPFLRDDVIFATATADRAALRKLFPDRRLYEMSYEVREPTIRVVPLR